MGLYTTQVEQAVKAQKNLNNCDAKTRKQQSAMQKQFCLGQVINIESVHAFLNVPHGRRGLLVKHVGGRFQRARDHVQLANEVNAHQDPAIVHDPSVPCAIIEAEEIRILFETVRDAADIERGLWRQRVEELRNFQA